MKSGIYPGTFDPVTAGHVDIITRSLKIVDKLYIAIAEDSSKTALFSTDERKEMLLQEIADNGIDSSRIEVVIFSGLMVKFAKKHGIAIAIRGLRAMADFEYEFQMSCMNTRLDSDVQTIFLPASSRLQLVSSKLVKEVVKLGGEVDNFLSDKVKNKLQAKYHKN
jgi:pantetheine-phosphate adenylyltransferase